MSRPSPHFFTREPDGSVRLRIRINNEEASIIEEAAGDKPLIQWIKQSLTMTAQKQVEQTHTTRPHFPPPNSPADETRGTT